MSAQTRSGKKGFFNILDNIEGDKVIWIIVFFLMMISILAISSSTSLLVVNGGSRIDVALEQVVITALGLIIIFALYKLGRLGIFRFFSKFGFLLSVLMVGFVDAHLRLPGFKATLVNDAWRCITVFGFQLHVFEFVKIFMIMYVAWASEKIASGEEGLAESLCPKGLFKYLSPKTCNELIYIVAPILVIMAMIAPQSNSSAAFIGGILIVTALIGGLSLKHLAWLVAAGLLVIGMGYGLYKASDGKMVGRVGTLVSRFEMAGADPLEMLHDAPDEAARQKIVDKWRQPVGAKVAVSEGGLIGKGPGNSTQRYIVSIIYEDYMFAFLVEEYGIAGALLILFLYGSLLARGTVLVRCCDFEFAKTAVSGLVLLISGQALMHILINVDLFPLTGQTLPLISHGNSSFLAFSLAFGILLSISKISDRKISMDDARTEEALDGKDEVHETLTDLDDMEQNFSEE